MESPDEKPVLSYQAPMPVRRWVSPAARVVATIATLCLLPLAIMLWRDRAQDAALAALAGAIFCLLVALGLVKTRVEERR